MESVIGLFILFMREGIKHSFEKLEPFVNIKEQDGIYFYRIMILLKTLLVLYTIDSMFPDSDTWFFFAVTNALTAMKYPPATVLIAAVQCLILPASSKKFALFSSTALFYILSIHIKFGEFLLDLYVVLSLAICSLEISCLEHQKQRTVLSIKILIVCYLCNVLTYSLKQLSLISCFLFLNHIPLRPISNIFLRKILYIYALAVIWSIFDSKAADSNEAQTLTGNLEFHKKWGNYESNIMSDNLEGTKLLETVRNPKMLNVSIAKLAPRFLHANLTCYSKIRENTCKAVDEKNGKTRIGDKFSSLSIYDDNLTGEVQKKNIHFMKLELHKWESASPKNREFNLISDVEVLEENVNSNNIRKYYKENVLTNKISPVNHSDNKKYHSLDNKNCVKADKEDSDDKRSMKNYIGLQENMSEKFKQYNEKKLPNSKCIKYVATINEHNFSQEFKSSIDEKRDLIPNARVAIRNEDQLQDISRRARKVIEISSDEIQKTSKGKNMQKVASVESQLIKSVQITDNITFYEQCLHEFSKLLNAEKIKQIEHMLMTILMRNEELKANLGSNHKIKEEKHAKESAKVNFHDKKSSSEKDTGRTDDEKSKELDFKEEKNNKLKYLKSKKDERKYRNDQKTSFIINDDIALRNSLDSIQKKKTKIETSIKNISIAKKIGEILLTIEERIADKPTRESKKLLIFNDNKNKNYLKKEQKRTKYTKSRTIRKQKIPLILDKKISLQNILDSIQEEKTKYEANSKSVSSSTETGEILIINDKKRNSNKSTRESEKTVIFSSRKNKEMLMKEKNAIEYETSLTIKPFRASKYSKNRLDTKDEVKLFRNILNGETKILGTLKESKTSKLNIHDSPHVLEFKTLPCIRRENEAQSSLKNQKLSKFNRFKKYLKKESAQVSNNIKKHFKRKK